MQNLMTMIATFFGVGYIPRSPGTFGTLATIPLVFLLQKSSPFIYMGVTLLLIPLSIFAAQVYEQVHGEHDSSYVVIDEVVGFLITMTWIPMTWSAYVGGFLLFRFFDILKPFPISYLDQNVKGGVGVVVDDVAAGLISNVILQILLNQTSWLGAQIVS